VVRAGRRAGAGWVTFVVILSLASYSVLTTAFIVFKLLSQPSVVPYPLLEAMPDAEGDNPTPGRKRSELRPLSVDKIAELNDQPVPDRLRVALGSPVVVGDLEVTPLKVERRRVAVYVENNPRPEPCPHDSLVLTLRLRSLAADYRFSPLDNYFDRKYDNFFNPKRNRLGPQPMTYLEVGKERYYGGPAEWAPLKRSSKEKKDRQWLALPGRSNLDDGLAPGETREAATCTDGEDPNVEARLDRHDGPLLWRVQVRRGLVGVGGRDVPATAVIGVDFTDKDYRKEG
jgi:hypothetical protein